MPAAASAAILTALTQLMTQWSSPRVQAQFARDADIRVEPADIPALYILGMQGARRAGALADDLRLSRPTMSKQLQRLEIAGLIIREADAADGRASIVALSDAGRDAYDALVARGFRAIENALSTWPANERDHFATLAGRFISDLGVGAPETTPSGHDRSQKEE